MATVTTASFYGFTHSCVPELARYYFGKIRRVFNISERESAKILTQMAGKFAAIALSCEETADLMIVYDYVRSSLSLPLSISLSLSHEQL